MNSIVCLIKGLPKNQKNIFHVFIKQKGFEKTKKNIHDVYTRHHINMSS
jgi:hypothetical protein